MPASSDDSVKRLDIPKEVSSELNKAIRERGLKEINGLELDPEFHELLRTSKTLDDGCRLVLAYGCGSCNIGPGTQTGNYVKVQCPNGTEHWECWAC